MGKELKKFYAVRIGRKPGIYNSWPECKSQIHKFPGSIYKSFYNLSEAQEFIKIPEKKSINNSSYAYVDGSFNKYTKFYGYGGFIMHNNQKYIIQGKGNEPNLVEMRNVAGEILGCQEVAKKAIQLGIKNIDIFYDYAGIAEWATGSWKRNKEGTKEYYSFMQTIKPIININFRKVEGHSGNEGNDEADRLAKEAVGIKVNFENNLINDYNDNNNNDNQNDNDNNNDNDIDNDNGNDNDKDKDNDNDKDNDKDNIKDVHNNEDNKIINKTDKIKDIFESCPNIGLRNIGATCYMNATLQCFCHIEKFVEYFKYSQQMKENISNNSLSASFKILIEELWPDNYNPSSPNNEKDYAPNDFKDKISKLNPIFEGIAANDAKDLVNFIIMTLHLELNKTIENKNNENKNYANIDQTNKKSIFDLFNEEVISKNNSIISQLFYATNCNTTRCCKCNTQIYNFQTYFFIVFPLEEVRKFKNDLINQQNQNNQYNLMNNYQNQFNNFNCNQQFQNNNYIINQQYQNYNYSMNMQNQNIYYNAMNQQYQNNNNMYQFSQNFNNYPNNQLAYFNNYNIINQQNQNNNIINQNSQSNNIINNDKNEVCLLDCFDYDKKDNIMNGENAMYCNKCKAIIDCITWTNLVTGPEILILLLNRGKGKEFDIKIIFDEDLDLTKYIENGCKYKLMGVISHLGESGMGGHFIAYCKDPITKKWYKYNDSLVNEVTNFKEEVIDFAMPYLLFYEKINNE